MVIERLLDALGVSVPALLDAPKILPRIEWPQQSLSQLSGLSLLAMLVRALSLIAWIVLVAASVYQSKSMVDSSRKEVDRFGRRRISAAVFLVAGWLFCCLIFGDWWNTARISHHSNLGSDGRRKQKRRRAENRTHAKELIGRLLDELKERGAESLQADRMTFSQLAKSYKASELVPAVYADGYKVHGRRSLATPTGVLKTLVDWFGSRKVRSITHSDVQSYRLYRLHQETIRKVRRSIASVNRELEQLRAVLNYAKRQGWLKST